MMNSHVVYKVIAKDCVTFVDGKRVGLDQEWGISGTVGGNVSF